LDRWGHDELLRSNLDVEQGWTRLSEPVLDRAIELRRLGNGSAPKAHDLSHLAEVRIEKVCEGRQQPFRLLLDLDEPQLPIVVDDDLDRQLLLDSRHELAEQHGKT